MPANYLILEDVPEPAAPVAPEPAPPLPPAAAKPAPVHLAPQAVESPVTGRELSFCGGKRALSLLSPPLSLSAQKLKKGGGGDTRRVCETGSFWANNDIKHHPQCVLLAHSPRPALPPAVLRILTNPRAFVACYVHSLLQNIPPKPTQSTRPALRSMSASCASSPGLRRPSYSVPPVLAFPRHPLPILCRLVTLAAGHADARTGCICRYVATREDEVSIQPGWSVAILEESEDGWVKVHLENGDMGYVPN